MALFKIFLLLISLSQTYGHGAIFYPIPWLNQVGNGLVLDSSPDSSWSFYFEGPQWPRPDAVCQDDESAHCSGCSKNSCIADYFTNHTFIPGEPTLPDDMYSCGPDCSESQLEKLKAEKHPWTSPGSAPIFGEGCGVNGGNPYGCQCHEEGTNNNCYGDDESPYGSCCGNDDGCGGYTGGSNATDHANQGLFDDAAVTVWARGENAEVIWKSKYRHEGGYAYRLCKVPADGVIGITEKCFQNGHLEFYGPYTWLMYVEDENSAGEITMQRSAIRTTEGTTPEGSEWSKINAPTEGELGDQFPAQGWGIKDYVQVPESLKTGQYILSFRWDSQHTPQVWHSCANIEIV